MRVWQARVTTEKPELLYELWQESERQDLFYNRRNKEIANELCLSAATVKHHVHQRPLRLRIKKERLTQAAHVSPMR
jgi:predicted transcriptional regulator